MIAQVLAMVWAVKILIVLFFWMNSAFAIDTQTCFLNIANLQENGSHLETIRETYRDILNQSQIQSADNSILSKMIEVGDPWAVPAQFQLNSESLNSQLSLLKTILHEKFKQMEPVRSALIDELKEILSARTRTSKREQKGLIVEDIKVWIAKWKRKIRNPVISPDGKMLVSPIQLENNGDQIEKMATWDIETNAFNAPNIMALTKALPLFSPSGDRVYTQIDGVFQFLGMNKRIGPSPLQLSSTNFQMGNWSHGDAKPPKRNPTFLAKGHAINPSGNRIIAWFERDLLVEYIIKGDEGNAKVGPFLNDRPGPIHQIGYLPGDNLLVLKGDQLITLEKSRKTTRGVRAFHSAEIPKVFRLLDQGKQLAVLRKDGTAIDILQIPGLEGPLKTFRPLKENQEIMEIETLGNIIIANVYDSVHKSTKIVFYHSSGGSFEFDPEIKGKLSGLNNGSKSTRIAISSSRAKKTYVYETESIINFLIQQSPK